MSADADIDGSSGGCCCLALCTSIRSNKFGDVDGGDGGGDGGGGGDNDGRSRGSGDYCSGDGVEFSKG